MAEMDAAVAICFFYMPVQLKISHGICSVGVQKPYLSLYSNSSFKWNLLALKLRRTKTCGIQPQLDGNCILCDVCVC